MRGADLALVSGASDSTGSSRAVVLGHVDLELLGVCAGGRLPAAVLLDRVEVVGQVLGLRVADFPVGGETCFLWVRRGVSVGMLGADMAGVDGVDGWWRKQCFWLG